MRRKVDPSVLQQMPVVHNDIGGVYKINYFAKWFSEIIDFQRLIFHGIQFACIGIQLPFCLSSMKLLQTIKSSHRKGLVYRSEFYFTSMVTVPCQLAYQFTEQNVQKLSARRTHSLFSILSLSIRGKYCQRQQTSSALKSELFCFSVKYAC